MILVFLFMAGYYMLGAPNQQVPGHSLTEALQKSDLRGIAECAAHTHANALRNIVVKMDCMTKFDISNGTLCTSTRGDVVDCASISKTKQPALAFVITSSMPIEGNRINDMLDILGENYRNASNFGVFVNTADKSYILSANSAPFEIPANLMTTAEFQPGQLVYITKYSVREISTFKTAEIKDAIICPTDEIKTMRYGRWQCVPKNEKIVCTGDTIWNSETQVCIPDPHKKPLCSSKQTAVMIDDTWTCADPINEKICTAGTIAKLNYTTLAWECVTDPSSQNSLNKCVTTGRSGVFGTSTETVRVNLTACTDCEEMITDPDTCETYCVPSVDKLNTVGCYANISGCSGNNRAFYFGFPTSANYLTRAQEQISEINNALIPLDSTHSQNRKFNCMDCGNRTIDTENSVIPFIAVCK